MPHHIPSFMQVTARQSRSSREGYKLFGWNLAHHMPRWIDGLGPDHGGDESQQKRAVDEFKALPADDAEAMVVWLRKYMNELLGLVPRRRHIQVAKSVMQYDAEREIEFWE